MTLARKHTRRARPASPGGSPAPRMESMIRVDHAGEFGAVRIYEGQLAVLRSLKPQSAAIPVIAHMAEQEVRHLKAFDQLIVERGIRPTLLSPLWQVAGFALGAGTALLGEKSAMACTAAVEEVINDHYGQQIEQLEQGPELKDQLVSFRADENAHHAEAMAQGAEQAPAYGLLSATIKAGCRLAIRLSERI